MAEIIEKIKEKLKKHPLVNYDKTENSISVLPILENGFTVSLEIYPDNFKVFYENWHEDFEDEDEALNCFAFGLSNECRLKQFSKNGEAYKWTLEYKDGQDWVADSTVSLFNFSFWKITTIEYLQNDLIK